MRKRFGATLFAGQPKTRRSTKDAFAVLHDTNGEWDNEETIKVTLLVELLLERALFAAFQSKQSTMFGRWQQKESDNEEIQKHR